MSYSNAKGFTLIELMIVVTILGILSWLAIPKYQKYSLKATASTQITSAIRPLQNAIFEYVAFNGELPVSFADLARSGFVGDDGLQYDSAADFANSAVSGIEVSFPTDSSGELILGVKFACAALSSSCTKVAPKALQALTAEIVVNLSDNGSINILLDPSRDANLAFKDFLPSL